MEFNSGWYLMYTRPNHEKKVSKQLEENNIDFFLPTQKAIRVWHDRKKLVQAPLFPSYVFVFLKKMDDFFAGLECIGSLHYVRFGKEVAKVPEQIISNLKIIVNNLTAMDVSTEKFRPGQQVTIKTGVLAGLDCEIVQQKSQTKLLVRVSMLNRNVLADINYELIR